MTNIVEYLATHENRQIKKGKSGAEIFEVEGKYVLKYTRRDKLSEPELFTHYRREAEFYQVMDKAGAEKLSWMPEILEVRSSVDDILILMRKYREVPRDRVDGEILRKIMRALAQVHSQEVPIFLRQKPEPPQYLESGRIEECIDGWRAVLAEHPVAFDEGILMRTAEKINELIEWHHGERLVLSHGDFHWDNLLQDGNGDIVICDWQGVNAGGASGDISFFLSRLGADGTALEPEKVIECYCRERFLLTGEMLSKEELHRHMDAANAITTFQFWHQYLHGSSCERVRGIYEKMAMP